MSNFLCKIYYNKVFKNKGDESLLPIIIINKNNKVSPLYKNIFLLWILQEATTGFDLAEGSHQVA
jgi:hypothetical protein